MPHVFEPAASGRSRCRGCGRALAKGEIRFGEAMANPFAEGTEMTLWFHPMCAAYKRPEAIIEALAQAAYDAPDRAALETTARASAAQRRLQRIDGVERAKGQATCRHCREPIAKGEWRMKLVFFEEGRFNPSGFIHMRCAAAYLEAGEFLDHALHFSPDLTDADRAELRSLMKP
jgi:hypothetical protein